MILGLFTELMTPGGIQRIGRHTAAVLASFAQEQGFSCCLLSLNDPPGRHDLKVGNLSFSIEGFNRRKTQFILSALALAGHIHLVFLGHPSLAPLGLFLKMLRPSTHYWVYIYGIDAWKPLMLASRLGLRFAYGVAALSRLSAERAITTQHISPVKVSVLPPALDPEFSLDRIKTIPRPSSLPSGKLLLTVARLDASEQYKGVDNTIRALQKVLHMVPDTYYVVVGDGDDRLRLERMAANIGVGDRVIFTGIKVKEELASYYNACDIFVMPSHKEGFGVVFLEAMAFSKPVIGGNHGGTPEVVIDGVTGFLVRYGDVETLAECLIRLLNDDELSEQMGKAGRQHLEENFTFEHFRRCLNSILRGGDQCEF